MRLRRPTRRATGAALQTRPGRCRPSMPAPSKTTTRRALAAAPSSTSGSATVSNSTFVGNTAPINGGAVNIQSSGTLTLINSTLFNNSSGGLGGAMSSLGTVTVINSTFAANHASSGSVLATSNSNVTINNSVFADNVATDSPGAFNIAGGSTLATASNNVFFNNAANGIPDDQTGYGTSNFIVATTQPLAALGNFGGPTQTMPPLPGGAAICAGSVALLPSGLTQDQRGFPRTSGSCVDAGSVQISQTPAAVPACRCRCWPCSPACSRCSASAACNMRLGDGRDPPSTLPRHGAEPRRASCPDPDGGRGADGVGPDADRRAPPRQSASRLTRRARRE